MDNNTKIIAIRKANKNQADQYFVDLMDKTEKILNDDAKRNPTLYKSLSATDLENSSVEKIREACLDSPFDANEVQLISGQRFPDIIANTYYGVEVKSTKSNHWLSTGSSIVESTRNTNVDKIYMLFGKMGGNTPEFRCRPYEEVLYDIAVTHSPRYLINMELKQNETIFDKMGTTYDSLRTSGDAIDQVRHYYKEKAIRENKLEMPWWITSENIESSHSFNVTLWNTLPIQAKDSLQTKCMILFTEALNPKRIPTKYNQMALWLCSYNQVIVPNIRDFFSAGGQITHVNGERINPYAAQVFARIVFYSDKIREMLTFPTKEMLLLIKDYNPQLLSKQNTIYANWLNICCEYAKEAEVPLMQWIREKPIFTFSKH